MYKNKLTNSDYKQILQFYHVNVPKSTKQMKISAEKIMSEKLCRPIKYEKSEQQVNNIYA